MSWKNTLWESDLDNFVQGKWQNTFWLHLIWTPDTAELVKKVSQYVQYVLDKARNMNSSPTGKQTVSMEIIPQYTKFASWEMILELKKTVRWKHVYAFLDPQWDVEKNNFSLNDKLIHWMLTLNAIRTNWARSTNAILAYMPYARQDHPSKDKREPSSLEMIAGILSRETWENGNIITLDLHNPTSKWAFSGTTFINLFVWWLIEEVSKRRNLESPVLSWADQWWDKKITWIAKDQWLEHITVVKQRNYAKMNDISWTSIFWKITWKDVILHDDIVDTAWTLCSVIRNMFKKKPKSINVALTHGLYNKDDKWREAFDKIKQVIEEGKNQWIELYFYSTNSVKRENLPEFIEQVDVSTIIGNTLVSIFKWLWVERNNAKDYTK